MTTAACMFAGGALTGGAFPGGAFIGRSLAGVGTVVLESAHLARGGGGEGTRVSVQGHGEHPGGGGAPFAFACADQRVNAGSGFCMGMALPGKPDLAVVAG